MFCWWKREQGVKRGGELIVKRGGELIVRRGGELISSDKMTMTISPITAHTVKLSNKSRKGGEVGTKIDSTLVFLSYYPLSAEKVNEIHQP